MVIVGLALTLIDYESPSPELVQILSLEESDGGRKGINWRANFSSDLKNPSLIHKASLILAFITDLLPSSLGEEAEEWGF